MKLVLRACAAPLRPAHLAHFLASVPGAGMTFAESDGMDEAYHAATQEAIRLDVVDDKTFAHTVRDLVFPATKKPIARLTPRNQFLALAPSIEMARIAADARHPAPGTLAKQDVEAVLQWLMPRPFVMGLDLQKTLEVVRSMGGITSPAKLRGFVEQHLGAACVFTYDG